MPAATFMLVTLVTQTYTDAVTLSAARLAAEQAAERQSGIRQFYGRVAAPYREPPYIESVAAFGVAGVIVLLGTSIAGGIVANETHMAHDPLNGPGVLIAYLVATAVFAAAAALALWDFVRAKDASLNAARASES